MPRRSLETDIAGTGDKERRGQGSRDDQAPVHIETRLTIMKTVKVLVVHPADNPQDIDGLFL